MSLSEVESEGSKSLAQEVVREAEDRSSPLSTSPSAKMIKIEEIAEVPSYSSDRFVAIAVLFPDWIFYLFLMLLKTSVTC